MLTSMMFFANVSTQISEKQTEKKCIQLRQMHDRNPVSFKEDGKKTVKKSGFAPPSIGAQGEGY
jgi:hypothetical protein